MCLTGYLMIRSEKQLQIVGNAAHAPHHPVKETAEQSIQQEDPAGRSCATRCDRKVFRKSLTGWGITIFLCRSARAPARAAAAKAGILVARRALRNAVARGATPSLLLTSLFPAGNVGKCLPEGGYSLQVINNPPPKRLATAKNRPSHFSASCNWAPPLDGRTPGWPFVRGIYYGQDLPIIYIPLTNGHPGVGPS